MSLRVSAGKLSPADKQRPLSKKIVLACSPTSSPSPASGKAHHISLGTSLSSESSRVIFTPVVKLLKKWQSLLGLATSLPRPLLPHDLSTSSSPAHLTALCSALTRRGTAFVSLVFGFCFLFTVSPSPPGPPPLSQDLSSTQPVRGGQPLSSDTNTARDEEREAKRSLSPFCLWHTFPFGSTNLNLIHSPLILAPEVGPRRLIN